MLLHNKWLQTDGKFKGSLKWFMNEGLCPLLCELQWRSRTHKCTLPHAHGFHAPFLSWRLSCYSANYPWTTLTSPHCAFKSCSRKSYWTSCFPSPRIALGTQSTSLRCCLRPGLTMWLWLSWTCYVDQAGLKSKDTCLPPLFLNTGTKGLHKQSRLTLN